MSGERPVAISLKGMGGMSAPRGSIGRSAGSEGFSVRAAPSIARPEISLGSPFSEKFSPKAPLEAQRITPVAIESSVIRTPAPRMFGAYAPMGEFTNRRTTNERDITRPVTAEQVVQLLQQPTRRVEVSEQIARVDERKKPQIVWNYRSSRSIQPSLVESPQPIPTAEIQMSSVSRPEIPVSAPPRAEIPSMPASRTETSVQTNPEQGLPDNVISLDKERAIREELAHMAERQTPAEIAIPGRTADVARVIPLRVAPVSEAANVDNPPAEQSATPDPEQKQNRNSHEAGLYIVALHRIARERQEKRKKESQASSGDAQVTDIREAPSARRARKVARIYLLNPNTGNHDAATDVVLHNSENELQEIGTAIKLISAVRDSAGKMVRYIHVTGIGDLLKQRKERKMMQDQVQMQDMQPMTKDSLVVEPTQAVVQPVVNLLQDATVSSMSGAVTTEMAKPTLTPAVNTGTKERNRTAMIVQNLTALGSGIKDIIQKIYFKVDKQAQEVRRRDAFAAVEAYADAQGMVDGTTVAAAIGNKSKGDWVSALLRRIGYGGADNDKDGSVVVVKNEIAKRGTQKKKDMRTIVIAATEDTPAVDANKSPDGPLVGKREVETVVGSTLSQNLPIAA